MLILLSPAKSLSETATLAVDKESSPRLLEGSDSLVKQLRLLSEKELASLCSMSPSLAKLNYERFQSWEKQHDPINSRPALALFTGDVYKGLELSMWKEEEFALAQKQLRILSGLYGVLRPLDRIQPYRLEMGTRLKTLRGKNLYEFWGHQITDLLKKDLKKSGSELVIDLASKEYSAVVQKKDLSSKLITPVFKDEKNGRYKVIAFYAKKARGMMVDFIIRNRVSSVSELRGFQAAGYQWSEEESDEQTLTFLRPEQTK